MNLLANKVAIITGAGRGIGRAIALKYAQEGASVVITDLKIDETVEAFVKELEGLGVKAKAYASNAANFEDAHKLVEAVVSPSAFTPKRSGSALGILPLCYHIFILLAPRLCGGGSNLYWSVKQPI